MTDFNASLIRPNKGAAGINLRAFKKTVLKHFGKPKNIDNESQTSNTTLEYDNVIFYLNNGKVDQIELNNDYSGVTKDQIMLGSTKSEIEKNMVN